MRGHLLALAFIVIPSLLSAQEATLLRLQATKSLKCAFPIGSVGDWTKSGPTIERDDKGLTLHFDGIDWKGNRARLIGNQAAGDVVSISSQAAISFFETTGFGNVNVTTVFASYQPGTDRFIAVTSRHVGLGIPGPVPVTSQYYGTCRVWE